jgi:heme-degrading monooxygenase HmoA
LALANRENVKDDSEIRVAARFASMPHFSKFRVTPEFRTAVDADERGIVKLAASSSNSAIDDVTTADVKHVITAWRSRKRAKAGGKAGAVAQRHLIASGHHLPRPKQGGHAAPYRQLSAHRDQAHRLIDPRGPMTITSTRWA